MNRHQTENYSNELIDIIDIINFFSRSWKTLAVFTIIGGIAGFAYAFSKKHYKSKLVFNSFYEDYPINDDATVINKNYNKLFKRKGTAKEFSTKFFDTLFQPTPSIKDSQRNAALSYFGLQASDQGSETAENHIYKLESDLIRAPDSKLLFELKFTPRGSYEITLELNQKGAEFPIAMAVVKALNASITLYNKQLITAIRGARELDVSQVTENLEKIQKEYVESFSSSAKEKGQLGVRLYKLKNKIKSISPDNFKDRKGSENNFMQLIEKSPMLFLSLSEKESFFSNLSRFDEVSLLQKLAQLATQEKLSVQKSEELLSEFANIRRGHENVKFKYLPINLAYNSNLAALRSAQEEVASPIEIRSSGLLHIAENRKTLALEISRGTLTKQYPSRGLSTLIFGFASFAILTLILFFKQFVGQIKKTANET